MGFADVELRQSAACPDDVVAVRESVLSTSQFLELELSSCDGCPFSEFCPKKYSLKAPSGKFVCAVKKSIGDNVQSRLNLRDPVVALMDLTKSIWTEVEFDKWVNHGKLSKNGTLLAKLASDNVTKLNELLGSESGKIDLSFIMNQRKLKQQQKSDK